MSYRIGFGTDVHRLVPDRSLIIAGVNVPSDLGAEGHSDADIVMHAVADALFGSIALGDIGTHFPNGDERWRNSGSSQFVLYALGLINEKGYSVVNVDVVIELEGPKLRPYIEPMRESLAAALRIDIESVSIKAKTGEGVDAVGERWAIRAQAIILVTDAPIA